MAERLGLYEYLGVKVRDGDHANGTSLTHTDTETYDDDPGLADLGVRSADGTLDTRTDNETFDDDPGLGDLGSMHIGMDRTAQPAERYDESRLDDLGVLGNVSDTTLFTKVDGETHDESGLGQHWGP